MSGGGGVKVFKLKRNLQSAKAAHGGSPDRSPFCPRLYPIRLFYVLDQVLSHVVLVVFTAVQIICVKAIIPFGMHHKDFRDFLVGD
jgi:hypothetical protein